MPEICGRFDLGCRVFQEVFAGSEGMFGKFQDSVSIWRRVWTPPKAFGRFWRHWGGLEEVAWFWRVAELGLKVSGRSASI